MTIFCFSLESYKDSVFMNRFEKQSFLMSPLSQRFVCLPYLFKMNKNYIMYCHTTLTFLKYDSICCQCEHLYPATHEETKEEKLQHVAELAMTPRSSVLKSVLLSLPHSCLLQNTNIPFSY